MLSATNLGFFHPLQSSLIVQKTLSGQMTVQDCMIKRRELVEANWHAQSEAGITHLPSNDVYLTDPMYDMAHMLGVIDYDFKSYYQYNIPKNDWYKTGQLFYKPDLTRPYAFESTPADHFIYEDFRSGLALNLKTRPILIGPLSFLQHAGADIENPDIFANFLPRYMAIICRLEKMGAEMIQIDEPSLGRPLSKKALTNLHEFLVAIAHESHIRVLLAPYFNGLEDNLRPVMLMPYHVLHVDLITCPDQYTAILDNDQGKTLCLGIVDAQKMSPTDIFAQMKHAERSVNQIGLRRTMISPHCPMRFYSEAEYLEKKTSITTGRLEKLRYLSLIAKALNKGKQSVQKDLMDAQKPFLKMSDIVENK